LQQFPYIAHKQLLGGFAALMLLFVLRFWTPRYRANPRDFAVWPRQRTIDARAGRATMPPECRNRADQRHHRAKFERTEEFCFGLVFWPS